MNIEKDAQEWDARYSESEQIWSGNPNQSLVRIAQSLGEPGTAADVGCGEGADALWLNDNGWKVTAFDPSRVAIDRARAHDENSAVEWLVAGLGSPELQGRTFDFVSAMYPALNRDDNNTAEEALFGLVAPGGHLLFVHHVVNDEQPHPHLSPDTKVMPERVLELSQRRDEQWEVLRDEEIPRHVTSGQGAAHRTDRVVLLRRSGS